jgi:hypothetical protein
MKAGRVLRFDSLNAITNDDLPQPEPAVGQLLVRDCPPQINNRASALDLWSVRIGSRNPILDRERAGGSATKNIDAFIHLLSDYSIC